MDTARAKGVLGDSMATCLQANKNELLIARCVWNVPKAMQSHKDKATQPRNLIPMATILSICLSLRKLRLLDPDLPFFDL